MVNEIVFVVLYINDGEQRLRNYKEYYGRYQPFPGGYDRIVLAVKNKGRYHVTDTEINIEMENIRENIKRYTIVFKISRDRKEQNT